ncbi:FtsX-like permease family protein [Streptomyces sp. TX20-6-3]|uniref:FtsX-like permease family protein n=1 Tax=Streptomyces sp. TX20-6-3 TaxID=3028705 RepID=UPI0029A12CD6|nr:FtsX-like permease family protein [Streptomyces sp. TX20-6-3]MDX2565355.1 FtsX-like permease family protein [Streptomyces sp. TX20-6-3]
MRRIRFWARDLAMGLRMAADGGRQGWGRTLLSAVGIGLGVMLLLIAAAVPSIVDGHAQRVAERATPWSDKLKPGVHTMAVVGANEIYRGREVYGLLLAPDGDHPPLPPGLTRVPGPGEVVVSPALARLLASPDGKLLGLRFTDRAIAGTIGDAGLTGPNELAYYEGRASLDRYGDALHRLDRFGIRPPATDVHPIQQTLIIVALIILLFPVAVLAAAGARFGGEQRDRRLAALRLVGADTAMVRRIAAGESLLAALCGLVCGTGAFLLVRQLAGAVTLQGLSVFPAEIVPRPVLAALIVLFVPVAAVAVAVFAMRRVSVEPLGVVRESTGRRRRLWWRLLVAGIGLLAFAKVGSISNIQVSAGVVLLLFSIVVLLPWLVEAAVQRLRGGPLSWQLATRRLQLSSGTAARAVSGVTVAVAGAVALQMFVTGVQAQYTEETGHRTSGSQLRADTRPADYLAAESFIAAIRSVPGVQNAKPTTRAELTVDFSNVSFPLVIGDCRTLRQRAHLPGSCADGEAFVPEELRAHFRAGSHLRIQASGRTVTARLPARTRLIGFSDPGGTLGSGSALYATPDALDLDGAHLRTTIDMRLDPARPDTAERVAAAALRLDSQASVTTLKATELRADFADIQRGLSAGAIGVLFVIGASLLVAALEQLRQARRPLSVLASFGTRRTTLALSVLWQTAVPMVVGLTLATAGGVTLGSLLLRSSGQPIRINLPGLLTLTSAGAVVTLVVTAVSLPLLWRLMRPEGLRAE